MRLTRAVAVLLAVPFLTFASALAPQHVHEPGRSHDHAIAHSHFAPHHHHLDVSETSEIEHDDAEHVVWLDSAILHRTIHEATHVPPALPVCDETVRATGRWSILRFDHAAPPHGPPKNSNYFRGPPPRRLS